MFKGKSKKGRLQEDPSFLKKDIMEWSVHDVGTWLNSIDLPQYQDVFFFNEVDGEMLADIDDDDLLALPIDRMAHRKKILRRVQVLKGLTPSEATGSAVDSKSDIGSENSESIRSDVNSNASSGTGKPVRVKCAYHDDIRTLILEPNETYESFKLKVLEEFGANKAAKYKDDEGDMITIRNTEDVRGIIQMSSQRNLRLIIFSSRRKKKSEGKSSKRSKKSGSTKDKKSKSSKKEGSVHSSDAEANVLENFVEAVIISNRRGIITFWNTAAEDLFGYDREEAIGQNVSIIMPPAISENHNKYIRRYRREGNSRIIGKGRQVEAVDKDGNRLKCWISLSETNTTFTAMMKLIQDGDRQLVDVKSDVGVAGVREEFSSLDEYHDPMLVIDANGILQYVNHMTYVEFAFEDGKLLGQPISVVCPLIKSVNGEADLLADYIAIKRGSRSQGNLLKNNMRDVVCYTSKGFLKAFNAEFSSRAFMGKELYLIHMRRQEAPPTAIQQPSSSSSSSSVVKSALQMQREVIASLVIPAIVLTPDSIIQEMNKACCELFGYTLSEVLGRNVNMLIPPGEVRDSHNDWVKTFAETGNGRGPNGTSSVVGKGREVTGISKSGKNLNLKLSVTFKNTPDGKIFTGIFQLIGEYDQHAIESQLLQQQIQVIEFLPVPSCIITADSKIRSFNAACQELFGYEEKEVLNQDVVMLMPVGELRGRHPEFVKNFADGKKKDSVVVGKGRKIVGRHKNGSNVTAILSVTERRDGPVVFYTGIFAVQ